MSKPVIKLVGGASIRAKGSNWGDFFDYGTKLTFPEIPDNTIWIDRGLERHDFLSAALQGLNELEFMGHVTKDQIIDKDRLIDLWVRRSCAPQDKDADIYVGEYHSSLVHTGDMKVYLVNGEAVRDYVAELLKNLPESDAMKQAYTEWIEGGNGYKYPWIPKNEIWLDAKLAPHERDKTLLHEYVESMLMKDGMSYDDAHKRATKAEYEFEAKRHLMATTYAKAMRTS